MTTYKDMQRNYLSLKNVAEQKQQAADRARRDASKCHSDFLRYCRAQLKACKKAGLVNIDTHTKGHYRVPDTGISLCVDSSDDGIYIYNYDRTDYFACPLENVKFAFNSKDNYIWYSLTSEEQEKINKIMECIL